MDAPVNEDTINSVDPKLYQGLANGKIRELQEAVNEGRMTKGEYLQKVVAILWEEASTDSVDPKSDQGLAQDEIRELQKAVNEGRVTKGEYFQKVVAIIWAREALRPSDEDEEDEEDEDEEPTVEDVTNLELNQQTPRFECGECVVCRLPGGWAPGRVIEKKKSDLQDQTKEQTRLLSECLHIRLDSASIGGHRTVYMQDQRNYVRLELCFGQRPDAESFTRACLPPHQSRGSKRAKLRFAAGERVACLVEDDSGDYALWKGGTVTQLWPCVPSSEDDTVEDEKLAAAYAVQLDNDCRVLVHGDNHKLVRDLIYQAEGVYNFGFCGKRFTKRRDVGSGEWELVDQSTRRARACSPPPEEQPHGVLTLMET